MLGVKRTVIVVAAFFAIGGSSFAAGRYVVTSVGQIKPSVLKTIERRAAVLAAPTEVSSGPSIAVCPEPGTEAVAGGFQWQARGKSKFELTNSYPRGREWVIEGNIYATGRNGSTGGVLTPIVTCRFPGT